MPSFLQRAATTGSVSVESTTTCTPLSRRRAIPHPSPRSAATDSPPSASTHTLLSVSTPSKSSTSSSTRSGNGRGPGPGPRPLPERVELLVLDFDGVLTDNRVWVDAEGGESVAADRGDGWGIARLLESGVHVVVLSTETDPVVAARCKKLGIPAVQGVREKGPALTALLQERGAEPEGVVYVGNDVNDLACFPIAACAVAVADAHPKARLAADLVLRNRGG